MRTFKILLMFLILGISVSFRHDNQAYDFEGKVEYDIIFPNKNNELNEKITTKFIIFYKQGNIRKEYRNINNKLLFYSIYKIDENTSYGIKPGNDTITYYQPTEDIFDYTNIDVVKNLKDEPKIEKVNGYECIQYNAQLKYSDSSDDEVINYSYFVSKELKVNLKNLKGDGSNFIFMKDGSIILKYIVDKPILRIVTVNKVNEEKLNKNLFTVELKNKTIQKL